MHASPVSSLIRTFSDPTDGAALKSLELIALLLDSVPDPFSRHHFTPGHITCTGLVLAPDHERVLLIHHRRLDRWLLPGGHVEPEDAEIWDAARREVIEETGAALVPSGHPPLAGLDVHGIPAAKGEPYHLHHDILFYFRADSLQTRVSPESHAVLWCAPADFDRYQIPDNTRRAYFRMRKLSFTP
ncbi:MAG TPA: NUDIX domain-containing protein [Candidatus Sulfopaludibacter sp.]|jgi:8-oxo-dGTP pyrophosphatase MutT (NUDIX family)|nr:NUDIX domain-containing protein [Candidatus Sulfopaludibacter sp.]